MKLKNSYFYTLREDVKDEESKSGKLLVRAGMIKKVGSGIYMYLPMGLRVLNKIKKIVSEEMTSSGAIEVLMPSLIPSEYYETCGRIASLGKSMFHLEDRFHKPFVLGPTHEELFTIAAKSKVKSYKDLPFTLYQMADKFRDEPRPRYGLIRVREFVMKDAYSFDQDEQGLDISYDKMKKAYNNIYDRLKINYKIVKADTGVMGGSLSEEYQAITDIGEDVLVLCNSCDYASNIEVSEVISNNNEKEEEKEKLLVATPNKETIEEVSNYLKVAPKKCLKAMLMNVNDELITFFIRGDREFNFNKACKLLNVNEINFASEDLIKKSNAIEGYTGPINLNTKIVIDSEILKMHNFICGANKLGYHYLNVNLQDFTYDYVGDISNVKEGDICPHCGGKLYFKKGIEIGNLFKLGTKYSEKLDLTYLDENNQSKPVVMGCYGLGIGRILASIIEQNNDENGIIFPAVIAPYEVGIVIIDTKCKEQVNLANKLYDELTNKGIDVILDDRDLRPGVKFKDLDLIGIPLRITIGNKIKENIVEVKERTNNNFSLVKIDEIIDYIEDYLTS